MWENFCKLGSVHQGVYSIPVDVTLSVYGWFMKVLESNAIFMGISLAKLYFWGFFRYNFYAQPDGRIFVLATSGLPLCFFSCWLHLTQRSGKKWIMGRWSVVRCSVGKPCPLELSTEGRLSPLESTAWCLLHWKGHVYAKKTLQWRILKGTFKLRKLLCKRQSSGTHWPSGIVVVSELRSNLRRPVLGALHLQNQLLPL